MPKLKVKRCVKQGGCFTREQLEEIAAAMELDLAGGTGVGVSGALAAGGVLKQVYYGSEPPFDTCSPWQQVNQCGEPIGKVKNYIDGFWQ